MAEGLKRPTKITFQKGDHHINNLNVIDTKVTLNPLSCALR